MSIYIGTAIFLSLAYFFIILRYIEGWSALKNYILPENYQPKTKVSLIIPARNEAKNILSTLNAIALQDYPNALLEVIVVDDFSSDETPELVQNFPASYVKLLKLADYISPDDTQSFKKKAIDTAIRKTQGDLIVCTDADCTMGPNWLAYLVHCYETKKAVFIAAPVVFNKDTNLFSGFQTLDFMGMICVTGAGIHRRFMSMCNGANLAYQKVAFFEVNGFEGIDNIASGDDMLLMQKMKKRFPDDIHFVKNLEAATFTDAKPNFKSFLNQRIRWASKSSSYKEFEVILMLALVWFFCLTLFASLALSLLWGLPMLILLGLQLVIKFIADWFFLSPMTRFFKRKDLLNPLIFIPSFFMHILYIALVGFLGNIPRKYEWKGRKVR